MYQVVKRDGKVVEFDIKKIAAAIEKAFDATQTDYGNEIENVLGVAGRVATANMNALENLPWATADYRELTKELSWVKALPQVPGGYFTERHIKNAFYTVYNNNEDPRETLQDYVKQINYEISRKRLEFGLPLE